MTRRSSARGSLTIWFDPGLSQDAAPTGRRGRQPIHGDAAIQTCLTMKVLFGMALRRAIGDWVCREPAAPGRAVAGGAGLRHVSCRQKTLTVTIPFRGTRGRLHLLISARILLCNTLPDMGGEGHSVPPLSNAAAVCMLPEPEGEISTDGGWLAGALDLAWVMAAEIGALSGPELFSRSLGNAGEHRASAGQGGWRPSVAAFSQ